jgi:hypothetical protein
LRACVEFWIKKLTAPRKNISFKPFQCSLLPQGNRRKSLSIRAILHPSGSSIASVSTIISSSFTTAEKIMSDDDMDFKIDPAAAEAAQKASAAASEQLDIIVPSTAPDATLEQRQLAEFNEWVRRYNTYQHQLESYWRERLTAEGITGGKGSGAAKSRKGNVNKDKWFRRYEELVSVHKL